MLRLSGGKLCWQAHDVLRMAKLVGDDLADLQRSTWIPSLAKLAMKAKLKVSPLVARRVEQQSQLIRSLRDLKARDDGDGRRTLFPHQRADLAYMSEAGLPAYLLAHQPGVGKTPEAIVWVDEQLNSQLTLVICPNSAKEQWAEEIQRWDQRAMNILVVQGTIAEQLEQISSAVSGWVIVHWEALVHARIALVARRWGAVIADEAQLAQNRRAQRTKTLFKLDSVYRMALSGHPFANDPTELHSILKFLYPQTYRSYWRYFFMFVEFYSEAFGKIKVVGTKRPKLLKWEIAPFTLRRRKAEVWKTLPPVTRNRRVGYLTGAGRREYDRLKKQFFVELQGRETKLPIINIMARTTRIRQWLVDPGLIGSTRPSTKYPIIHEVMRELDGPPVIFTMFRQAGVRMIQWLQRVDPRAYRRIGMIHGGMGKGKVQQLKLDFRHGKLAAVVVVTQAGGLALNLGKYGYVMHLDLPWNARDFEQTEGRVDRPEEGTGKMVPTTSTRVIVKDSFEDRVMEPMINDKNNEFGKVFTVNSLEDLLSA